MNCHLALTVFFILMVTLGSLKFQSNMRIGSSMTSHRLRPKLDLSTPIYCNMALQIDLKAKDNPNADILQLILEWLDDTSAGNRRWLMILDNVDDAEVFRGCENNALISTCDHTTDLISYVGGNCNLKRNLGVIVVVRSSGSTI